MSSKPPEMAAGRRKGVGHPQLQINQERLNHIHPFINGNDRTARAACYFVLCVMAGQWLPGTTILPELIRRDRDDYVKALEQIDASAKAGKLDIGPLYSLLSKLLEEQLLASTPDNAPPTTTEA